MNKQEFLEALAFQLGALEEAERGRSLAFYAEMIDDRVEGGASEAEAVASLGPVERIAGEILQSALESEPEPPRAKKPRRLRGWEIALLIVGAPLWLPLLAAAAVVALALLIVLWALVVSLWATAAALALGVPATIVAAGRALFQLNMLRAAACTATACVSAGCAILFGIGMRRATGRVVRITRFCWRRGIRRGK